MLTGTPMQLGEDLDFVYTLTNPVYGTLTYPGKVVAGSYFSVAVIGGSVAPEKLSALKTKLEGTQGILTIQDAEAGHRAHHPPKTAPPLHAEVP